MKIVLIGQSAFGKAVLEAFLSRGDQVVGVFCAPDKPGAKPDALLQAAQALGLPVVQRPSLKDAQAAQAMRDFDADLGVMAYVLQFVPQSLVDIPRHGTIQYHPSLLPRYRGPSAINWAIACGEAETGLSIFRPSDGLDEGPLILQRRCAIGPDETLGELYARYLFPEGVQALLDAASLVVQGGAALQVQDETQASYQGWFRADEARINWANSVDQVYNLIRACNPAPGAWTCAGTERVQILDSRKHPVRRFAQVQGQPGDIAHVSEQTVFINAQGGQIEILKVRTASGEKCAAATWARSLPAATRLQ